VQVVVDLPIGHGRHHATVPLRAQATIDADVDLLVIEEVITAPR
jgi:muramoyltetrapeptide carboxypeptidase LdcA involved in peptidoglycan recycling